MPSPRSGLLDWYAVALAELRTVRRLARTWVFLALGITVVGMAHWYYSYLHATSSSFSLNSGNALPRFTTAYFNSYVLWFFMAAMVFLAFDLRHRDQRERVAETIDSRPLSNIALLAGRLCAVVLAICLPLFGVLLLTQAMGTIGRAVGWWVDPIEPVATFVFFFLDAIPALILWCAIVFALAAGLRNRLAVAVAALALLGIHMWSLAHVPGYLLPAMSLLYIHDNWASDLAPRLPDLLTLLHRISMLMLAAAFAVWTAAFYPRSDGGSRNARVLIGILPAALGVLGIGTIVLSCIDGIHLRDAWLAAHRAAASEPAPRIEHLAAHVAIDPGDDLRLDLEMQVQAPEQDLTSLLFSFNPGLEVAELRLDDIETPFEHQHGLLTVRPPTPLASGTQVRLTLRASGVPDPDFAYLDSVVDWRRESNRNAILWLGTAGGIFEERYVALMPGLRWLPVPGANLDGASRGHSPTVELTVDVPEGWLVAAPGRRETLEAGRYRFRPGAGVPKLGLFAARFERRAMEVEGTELELLLHPSHLRNLDYYANVTERLRSRLVQIFRDADEFGIPYPYTGFSVVEVPAHLREYGGGHWLDTRMALPGILLMKEHGFPYANVWLYNDPSQYASYPGGLDALKIWWLEWMFSNDFTSGSALRAWSRNLVSFQTAADGAGASALDYVSEELGRELFRDPTRFRTRPTIYTAHFMDSDAGFGATVVQMIDGLTSEQSSWAGFRSFQGAQPSVWERTLDAPLAEMDFEREPRQAIGAFALRVNAVARSLADGLGKDRTAALLAALRGHDGGTYTEGDFASAVASVDADIERLVGDWLNDTALPGFVVSRAQVQRVATDADAQPQYEIRVHVSNDEPTPGLVRLALGINPQSPRGEPVRVDGYATVEIGMLSAEPPQAVLLEPYLALNRVPILIDLTDFDDQDLEIREPFAGARPSTWLPATPEGIVIDDLDSGFSVERRHERNRLGGSAVPAWIEFDQGLPTWTPEYGVWTRASIPSSWGKYRHTVAGARSGDGSEVAVFSAELPAPGRWQLDFHVPNRGPTLGQGFTLQAYGTLGSFDMTLVADGTATRVDFDGSAADVGWNKIGEFDLAATEVRLEISSRTDGEMVIADAIRWVQLD